MDLFERENLKKSLTNNSQNSAVRKETYQKAKNLLVGDHIEPNSVKHEDGKIDTKNRQQKLASGCSMCIKQ